MPLAPPALAGATSEPARTSAKIVAHSGLPRLADVDRVTGEVRREGPATPVRYECERPGKFPHVDVEKVARMPAWAAGKRSGAATAPPEALMPRLVVPARRDGRLLARRLRGTTLRQEEGDLLGVRRPSPLLLRRPRPLVERVMTDNDPGYRSHEFNALPSPGASATYTPSSTATGRPARRRG